ncbi:unnamed protein product [Adineta ricciae]|uniref:C2H2-type domain-containing protein n=1 Tax=Adineta ricciae TaxID=249248 RepID=A0A814ZNB0_ADIRI|nr:unnamed protein product [Adineta ricciae]
MKQIDPKSHLCSICNKSFARPSKLQYHIAFHHEKKFSFECSECGKPYSNQDHVNRHYRNVHQKENTRRKKFTCAVNDCAKVFANKQNLDRHVRIAHATTKSKPVRCFYCSEFVESLESHLIAEHNSISPDKFKLLEDLPIDKAFDASSNYSYRSSIGLCAFYTVSRGSDERRELDVQWTMNRLLDGVERMQIFQCDLCQRMFRSLFQLDQHRHSKIHQEQFTCQYDNCRRTFSYMRNLQHHIRTHHENLSRLPCPMKSCSKTFTCQASICRHLSRCHSSDDVLEQINAKQKQSTSRQQEIRRFLSGFNDRKLKQENEICQQTKHLLNLLLTEDNLVQTPDDRMEFSSNEKSFDPNLLQAYNEIGLVEL